MAEKGTPLKPQTVSTSVFSQRTGSVQFAQKFCIRQSRPSVSRPAVVRPTARYKTASVGVTVVTTAGLDRKSRKTLTRVITLVCLEQQLLQSADVVFNIIVSSADGSL
jgi:hypothetical protein